MRTMLIVGWLFAGLGGVIYHFGPGQAKLEQDRISDLIRVARLQIDQHKWSDAVQSFDSVLAEIPADRKSESRMIILEKAKAQMMAAQLPDARQTLEGLLTDVSADETADQKFVADVESTLASSQYYMTWLMRLEGLKDEEWMPEIEAARQHYTHLTRRAEQTGDSELMEVSAGNLESAIRLARMDLSELQALPLPSQ